MSEFAQGAGEQSPAPDFESLTKKELVFAVIDMAGDIGMTDEELDAATQPLGMVSNSSRARRVELVADGRIVDAGTTRTTKAGKEATVWRVATPEERVAATPTEPPDTPAVRTAKRIMEQCEDADVCHALDILQARNAVEQAARKKAKQVAKHVRALIREAEEEANRAAKRTAETGTMSYGDVITRLDGAAGLVAGLVLRGEDVPQLWRPIVGRKLEAISKGCGKVIRRWAGVEDPPEEQGQRALPPAQSA